MKVSVIIPVYNAEASLKRCLDSICGQTYPELEILLINDGSTDSSLEICQAYAARDSRIVLHTQKNAGPSATRNKGLELATGDYLAFVDSDDYIETDAIEHMAAVAKEHSVDMVVCNYYEEDGKTVRQHTYSHPSGYYGEEACHAIAMDVIDNNTKTRIPPYSWVRFVRREIFDNQELRYNAKVKRSEDYLLWTRVHFCIQSMYLMGDGYFYHYMYNPASITRTYLPNYWNMCKILYAELLESLPNEKEIRRKIRAMLIQRSLIALHNASEADEKQFNADLDEILKDKDLIRAVWTVGLFKNSKRARIYAVLVMLRLKFVIKKVFLK